MEELTLFKEICRKISLNIPEYASWKWDEERKMAMVILDEEDAELVFFPLFKEFEYHWNFSSQAQGADPAVIEHINANYGLMPGQAFFTSHVLFGHVLGVAWWPWGSQRKVSMRVGLIPVTQNRMSNSLAVECLTQWLDIAM